MTAPPLEPYAPYIREPDRVGEFLDMCCVRDQEGMETIFALDAAFNAWVQRIYPGCPRMSLKVFIKGLGYDRGFDSVIKGRFRYLSGLRLLDEWRGGRRGAVMSFCSCDYDGERARVHSATMRTARKAYRCCECRTPIHPGDTYQHVAGLWDGRWLTFKTCQGCANVRDVLCDCYEYGSLWDDWEGEIPLHGQNKLSPEGIVKLDGMLAALIAADDDDEDDEEVVAA